MKKSGVFRWVLIVLAIACLSVSALAEAPQGVLGELNGTYEELFPVISAEEYDEIWLKSSAEFVGEEGAEAAAEMLKFSVTGKLYGQEAVDAYAENPEAAQFMCGFIHGVALLTIDGNRISGTDADGNELFSHTYTYLNSDNEFGFAVYESDDENSGEFTYFSFAPDTPETTYHIEFRYGADLSGMTEEWTTGQYAYWMGAGFPVERDEALVENVIVLFCEENLSSEEQ